MPCYSPLTAYKTRSGDVVFSELRRYGDITQTLTLPCGQCIGCKLERARQWGVRCTHEIAMHPQNSFVTLTYSDEHLPRYGTLVYKHFVDFIKRLREHERYHTGRSGVRFYMGGEYGETTLRPHYHAILFGKDWHDKKPYTRNAQGDTVYISRKLEELWGMGQCVTAEANFRTAAYCARYCLSKRTEKEFIHHYQRQLPTGQIYYVEPEFGHMSLKPGIGATFVREYTDDIYNFDKVIINGKECKPPKYYDKLLQRHHNWAFEEIKEDRELEGIKHRADNTDERLNVKRIVTEAAIKQLKRGM